MAMADMGRLETRYLNPRFLYNCLRTLPTEIHLSVFNSIPGLDPLTLLFQTLGIRKKGDWNMVLGDSQIGNPMGNRPW